MTRLFEEQRKEVLAWLDKQNIYQKDVTVSYLPVTLPTFQAWTQRMFESLRVVMAAYAQEAYQAMWERFSRDGLVQSQPPTIEGSFPVINPRLSEAVDNLTLRFCEETNASTSQDLAQALEKTRDLVRQGTVEGLAIQDLTHRINEIFDQAASYRAKRIAITESSRAVHMAEQLSAADSGVVKGFKWLASGDACPLCEALNGKEVPLGTPFATGTSKVPEYADVYFPPRHVNCQCTILEVLLPEDELAV